MPHLLQCVCGWSGDESECDEVEVREPYEFWGMRGVQNVDYNVCPECGSDELDEQTEVCDE